MDKEELLLLLSFFQCMWHTGKGKCISLHENILFLGGKKILYALGTYNLIC